MSRDCNHNFVRARREVLETKDLPPSLLTRGVCSKCRAHFTFSTHDVSTAFHEIDTPHLVLVTILSCALVVEPLDDEVNLTHGVIGFSPPPVPKF